MWRSMLLAGLLALAQPAAAAPFVPDFSDGPVVFDFEDGTDGWVLEGAALWQSQQALEWIETAALGGSHAIRGASRGPALFLSGGLLFVNTPFAEMQMDVDLTSVGAVGFDHFFSGEAPDDTWFASAIIVDTIFVGGFFTPSFYELDPIPDTGSGHQLFDARSWTGVHGLMILWGCFDACTPGIWFPGDGYIDNVTLYPVPEPSPLALWAAGLLGLLLWRRRLGRKKPAGTPG